MTEKETRHTASLNETEEEAATQHANAADSGIGQAFLLFCISLGLLLTVGIGSQVVSLQWGLIFTLLVVVLLPAIIFVHIKGLRVVDGLRIKPVSPLHFGEDCAA